MVAPVWWALFKPKWHLLCLCTYRYSGHGMYFADWVVPAQWICRLVARLNPCRSGLFLGFVCILEAVGLLLGCCGHFLICLDVISHSNTFLSFWDNRNNDDLKLCIGCILYIAIASAWQCRAMLFVWSLNCRIYLRLTSKLLGILTIHFLYVQLIGSSKFVPLSHSTGRIPEVLDSLIRNIGDHEFQEISASSWWVALAFESTSGVVFLMVYVDERIH